MNIFIDNNKQNWFITCDLYRKLKICKYSKIDSCSICNIGSLSHLGTFKKEIFKPNMHFLLFNEES